MTLQHWTDYHAWGLSSDVMRAAQLALSGDDYAALFYASESNGADYLAPREAIEDAALAMPQVVAVQFLAIVYQVDHAGGAKLLTAIRMVRA